MLQPIHSTLFYRRVPQVKLTDLRSTTTSATTFTFTNCNIDVGSNLSYDGAMLDLPTQHRSALRKFVVAAIHTERTTAGYSISNVTLGGVAGRKDADLPDVSNQLSTAIWRWPTEIIQGISNTSIVVTMSSFTQTCAVGVMSVENVGNVLEFPASATAVGTGTPVAASISVSPTLESSDSNSLMIIASTGSSGASPAPVANFTPGEDCGYVAPVDVYSRGNGQMTYGVAYAWRPAYGDLGSSMSVSWADGARCNMVGVVYG